MWEGEFAPFNLLSVATHNNNREVGMKSITNNGK